MATVIQEMAAQREQKAEQPMTFVEAAELALRARTTPEVLIDGPQAKRALTTLLAAIERSPCFYKATLKGEEVFVLRQPDRCSPMTLEFWAKLAEANGCGKEKVSDAFAIALRWKQQPDSSTKWPD